MAWFPVLALLTTTARCISLSVSYFARHIIPESPKHRGAAMKSPHRTQWYGAEVEEIDALNENDTWQLVQLPKGRKAIGCVWVYKVKLNSDNTIERFKARLCAQGFSQIEHVDYEETFATVAQIKSLRIIIALSAHCGWHQFQVDFKSAFLNATLPFVVYMRQPRGHVVKGKESWVYLLKKSLYGLKNAGYLWSQELIKLLLGLHFKQLNRDSNVFVRFNPIIILSVHTDDVTISSPNATVIPKLVKQIRKEFRIHDAEPLHYYVGLQIQKDSEGSITISQRSYVERMLDNFTMSKANSIGTPGAPGVYHMNSELDPEPAAVPSTDYRSIIGSLMYAMVCSRPDIGFSIIYMSQFLINPNVNHMASAKRILRYLKGTTKLALKYVKGDGTPDLNLRGYVDSDWGNNPNNRRSVTGFLMFMCGGVISWMSRSQRTVALSSFEAELMALVEIIKEVLWIRAFLAELGFKQTEPTPVYCDNQGTIDAIHNPVHHDRSKHIAIRRHFLKSHLGVSVRILKIPGTENPSDMMTKFPAIPAFEMAREQSLAPTQ
jgi:hypothetical protein